MFGSRSKNWILPCAGCSTTYEVSATYTRTPQSHYYIMQRVLYIIAACAANHRVAGSREGHAEATQITLCVPFSLGPSRLHMHLARCYVCNMTFVSLRPLFLDWLVLYPILCVYVAAQWFLFPFVQVFPASAALHDSSFAPSSHLRGYTLLVLFLGPRFSPI